MTETYVLKASYICTIG